jgi:hypothetical protein
VQLYIYLDALDALQKLVSLGLSDNFKLERNYYVSTVAYLEFTTVSVGSCDISLLKHKSQTLLPEANLKYARNSHERVVLSHTVFAIYYSATYCMEFGMKAPIRSK